ncbi:E3 ubiquitin-protein ligase RFWD3 [Acropora cervicornis]|uniref:RING-type E3 ubiquitin transferase n=1 Tax=Acropora cervicornis TaxID=6130 RepID=A0AAD9QSQ0_ACRCE|nr:E3 ubiquitin-protein ligase RFWD3 [Acropora cervicornis]
MTTNHANDDDEVREIRTENGTSDEEQGMEIDPENENLQQVAETSDITQAVNGEPSAQDDASSTENITSELNQVERSRNTTEANSPDVFEIRPSKPSKTKSSKAAKSPFKSPEKDDDSQCCPICLEPWSNSGSHRLASLSCGHLFGRSCIERWLKSKGVNEKCPQCNAPAKRRDIRNIYSKAIKSIDTTERDRALADLETEREARQRAEEREARALLQYQLTKAECEKLVARLRNQEELVFSLQSKKSMLCSKCSSECEGASASVHTFGQSTSSQSSLPQKSYILQTSFQVSQGGARVLAFDQYHAVLVVSSLDSKHCEFVRIHQKPLRDAAFSCRGDGLLLTAAMDKTVRVTSMLSNTVVQRNTDTYLKSIHNEAGGSCPVISVAHVSPDPHGLLRPGGILVCKLEGASFWEKTTGADYLPHTMTLPEGCCSSLSFEPTTRHCLFSLRPSKKFPHTRHLICQLQGNGIGISTARAETERAQNTETSEQAGSLCTCQAVNQCVGGPSQKLLSKSRLFTDPDDSNVLMVAAGDESSSSTLIWNGSSGSQLQKLPNQGKETLDILPFAANGSNFLAIIDEQKLNVYKWLKA